MRSTLLTPDCKVSITAWLRSLSCNTATSFRAERQSLELISDTSVRLRYFIHLAIAKWSIFGDNTLPTSNERDERYMIQVFNHFISRLAKKIYAQPPVDGRGYRRPIKKPTRKAIANQKKRQTRKTARSQDRLLPKSDKMCLPLPLPKPTPITLCMYRDVVVTIVRDPISSHRYPSDY
jgi:hypothetical protein